jgi:hypothetical protein
LLGELLAEGLRIDFVVIAKVIDQGESHALVAERAGQLIGHVFPFWA